MIAQSDLDKLVPMLAKLNMRNMDFLRRASVLKFICEKHHLTPEQVLSAVARSGNRQAAQSVRYMIAALEDERIEPAWKASLARLGVNI